MTDKYQLSRDVNRVPLQTEIGFQTKDDTGTPKTSPLAYSSAVITLIPPNDAVSIVLAPSTDLRVSELIGMTQYYKVTAGSAEIFGCAKGDPIYIVRDSSNGTVNFRFNLA